MNISDDKVMEILMRLDSRTESMSHKLVDTCKRVDDHGVRLRKLENIEKGSVVFDWVKKGGVGGGVMGIVTIIYYVLEKLL